MDTWLGYRRAGNMALPRIVMAIYVCTILASMTTSAERAPDLESDRPDQGKEQGSNSMARMHRKELAGMVAEYGGCSRADMSAFPDSRAVHAHVH